MRVATGDILLTAANDVLAQCDYEVQQILINRRFDRAEGFQVFTTCVRAKGFDVLTPQQFRQAADDWNARHPTKKAMGVARTLAD